MVESIHFDISNEEVLSGLIIDAVGFMIFPTLLFYVTQIHEISRFYQQQSANNKQSQISHVLNSQSDSIIVVSQKDPLEDEESSDMEGPA